MIGEIFLVFFVVVIVVLTYATIKPHVKNKQEEIKEERLKPMWTNTRWRGNLVPPPPISQTKKEFKFLRGYDKVR